MTLPENSTPQFDAHPLSHRAYVDAQAFFGGAPDGVADDTSRLQAAIQAAKDEGIGHVFIPQTEEPWRVLNLSMVSGVSIISNGATLKKLSTGSTSSSCLQAVGVTTSTSANLTANATHGDITLTVASAASFAADDIVVVRDSTYATAPTTGRNRELARVLTAAGGTITLSTALHGTYLTANTAQVVKITPCRDVSVSGLRLEQDAGNAGGNFYAEYAYNILVEECVATHPYQQPGFWFGTSAIIRFDNCSVYDGYDVANSHGYGFFMGEASHDWTVNGFYSERTRESGATSAARHGKVINSTFRYSYDDGWNTHGENCTDIIVTGCHADAPEGAGFGVGQTSLLAQDQRITFFNCRVTDAGAAGFYCNGDYASGYYATDIRFVNCEVDGYGLVDAGVQAFALVGTKDVKIISPRVNAKGYANAGYGIVVANSDRTLIQGGSFREITNGYGLVFDTVTQMTVEGVQFHNLGSYAIYWANASTNSELVIRDNRSTGTGGDDNVDVTQCDAKQQNVWGANIDISSTLLNTANNWSTSPQVLAHAQNDFTYWEAANSNNGTAAQAGLYCQSATSGGTFGAWPSNHANSLKADFVGIDALSDAAGISLIAGNTGNITSIYSDTATKFAHGETVTNGSGSALATNTNTGHFYIPSCAGPPTGTPTAYTGAVAMVYDTSNNKLYVYNGSWKGGTAPGVFS